MNRKEFLQNAAEKKAEMLTNAGYDVDITTLTGIRTRISEQKFYTVKVSDFMPVILGENTMMDEQKVFLEDLLGEDFESGIIDATGNAPKKSQADSQLRDKTFYRHFWSRERQHNILQLQQASKLNNWSLIESKEKSMKKAWDLGIQKVAFMGLESDTRVKGLLNQTDVNSNTTVITKAIKSMNATEFATFLGGAVPAYFTNSGSTAYPDTFVLPTDDFLGLGSAIDEGYGNKSRLTRMKEAFAETTLNPDFKIMPVAYASKAQSGLSVDRYVLYRRNDADSLYMDIPLDYTTTAMDTLDGFNYNAVAYGQFSGCNVIRPQEVLYFDY